MLKLVAEFLSGGEFCGFFLSSPWQFSQRIVDRQTLTPRVEITHHSGDFCLPTEQLSRAGQQCPGQAINHVDGRVVTQSREQSLRHGNVSRCRFDPEVASLCGVVALDALASIQGQRIIVQIYAVGLIGTQAEKSVRQLGDVVVIEMENFKSRMLGDTLGHAADICMGK
ncbi:hypothetical protein D3C72_679460 [compost metagenome]